MEKTKHPSCKYCQQLPKIIPWPKGPPGCGQGDVFYWKHKCPLDKKEVTHAAGPFHSWEAAREDWSKRGRNFEIETED